MANLQYRIFTSEIDIIEWVTNPNVYIMITVVCYLPLSNLIDWRDPEDETCLKSVIVKMLIVLIKAISNRERNNNK